ATSRARAVLPPAHRTRPAPPAATVRNRSRDQVAQRPPLAAIGLAETFLQPVPPTARSERCRTAKSRTAIATDHRGGRTAPDNAFRNSRATSRSPAGPSRPDRKRADPIAAASPRKQPQPPWRARRSE